MHPEADTPVDNSETLLRVVKHQSAWRDWPRENGQLQISAVAFSEPGLEPSVDRLKLLESPDQSKFDIAKDGLLSLAASAVRSIEIQDNGTTHVADIIPRPSRRPAHALVVLQPAPPKTSYRQLYERLAAIASWIDEPV